MNLGKTRLLAGFFLSLLSGCSSLPEIQGVVPRHVELTDTPFYPQDEYQCGPAALATVLSYRGVETRPDELKPYVYLPDRKGSLQTEMVATARRFGMLAYPLSGNLNDLFVEVAAGNPVLVLQNLTFDWLPTWHYAVVVGYDLDQHEVILRSGVEKRWRSKLSAFNNTWQRADYWAIVIVKPDEIPVTAEPASYLKAAYDLESTGQPETALIAYRAATQQWLENLPAWLAVGNSAFSLGRIDEAYDAFKRVLAAEPENTIALNNLAYVYLAGGCPEQARATIEQVLRIQPDDDNLQTSMREVNAQAESMQQADCRFMMNNPSDR